MHLRYLSAVNDIAGDKSTTILFPLPMELFGALAKKPEGGGPGT
jgi:hypothetical protein